MKRAQVDVSADSQPSPSIAAVGSNGTSYSSHCIPNALKRSEFDMSVVSSSRIVHHPFL